MKKMTTEAILDSFNKKLAGFSFALKTKPDHLDHWILTFPCKAGVVFSNKTILPQAQWPEVTDILWFIIFAKISMFESFLRKQNVGEATHTLGWTLTHLKTSFLKEKGLEDSLTDRQVRQKCDHGNSRRQPKLTSQSRPKQGLFAKLGEREQVTQLLIVKLECCWGFFSYLVTLFPSTLSPYPFML